MKSSLLNDLQGFSRLKFLLCLFIFFMVRVSFAQDFHFSMYKNCPLYLNPANTGNFTGDWRVAGNFRNQWAAISVPFRTSTVSFDKPIYFFNQNISVGGLFVNDQSGSLALSVNALYGSIGYRKNYKNNVFILGLQLGYVFKSLDLSKVTLPEQWDITRGDFYSGNPSGEQNMSEKFSHLDFNLGVIWKRSIKIFEPEAGISFSHLNNPRESFFSDKEKLPVKSTIFLTLKTKVNDEFYLTPSLLYMNEKGATEMNIGSDIGYNIIGKQSLVKEVYTGIYLRDGLLKNIDALTFLAGVTVNRITMAFSYDMNLSGLKTATAKNGAFEISLIYKSISTVLNSYSIPCERF